MKRNWQIRRQTPPCPQGQHRWDRAYQLLLAWSQLPPMARHRGRQINPLNLPRRFPMRVAAYIRVSTLNQVQTQTIEHQLEHVRRFCLEKAWGLEDASIFRDDGYNGAC